MTNLRHYKKEDFSYLSYQLDDQQSCFTADIDYCVNQRKDLECLEKTLVVIDYHNEPVGFFVLDYGNDKYGITDNTQAVAIRSLSINPRFQGKGIAKQTLTLVPRFIQNNLSQCNEIVLSVNVKNTTAYHAYIKSGYHDTGAMTIGPAGPQHVLQMLIVH